MKVQSIKTHKIKKNESLADILISYLPPLTEDAIVVITSKIISVCQGCMVEQTFCDKNQLIAQEAEALLHDEDFTGNVVLTIKNNMVIASAGIDSSNSEDSYILYPKNIQETANQLWHFLRQHYGVCHLGLLITDSRTAPMRIGVTGVALAWCGFSPLYSYIGKPDIYDKPMRVTEVNLLDALAAAAVLVMGEGSEHTPIAIISNAPKVSFLQRSPTAQELSSIIVSPEKDLYAPIFKKNCWRYKKEC